MSRKRFRLTSRTTRSKKNKVKLSGKTPEKDELVFVVDFTSFTEKGYECSSSFEGKRVDIEFDDADEGLVLSKAMCKRARLKKGSAVMISVEGEQRIEAFESVLEATGDGLRFSNAKLYYLLGGLGGAIIRIRRA